VASGRSARPSATRKEHIAIVLAGGGARGAYEAGALSVLLPELDARGMRPDIVLGTSVGALNAAFVAANAARPIDEVIDEAERIWSQISYGQVLEPLVPGGLLRLAQYVGEAFGVPAARVWSILDPSPLRATLGEIVDFGQISDNVGSGVLHAAGVVATAAATSRTVVFHHGGQPPHVHDDYRAIDYVPTPIHEQHVRASAAIPTVFPAVQVETPAQAAGWYFDGGTRLNTPIKPALWLGATRVVVVALNSLAPGNSGTDRPDALEGAGQIAQAVLGDPLIHDVQTLRSVNRLVPSQGRAGKRPVKHIVVAPRTRTSIGEIAHEVFVRDFEGLRGAARNPEMAALGRAVAAGRGPAYGELLSYLFFAPQFTRRLFALGAEDARAWLERPHDADDIWDLRAN
jgi:NTE family protein